jgi:hypothetical protein
MYVVIEMFACVGVISNTSVNTVSAGSTSVAPNGEISADMETRKMIQLFIPGLKTLYGGPDTVRCSAVVSRGSVFSTSVMSGAIAMLACCLSASCSSSATLSLSFPFSFSGF